jgi:hypothetical protein
MSETRPNVRDARWYNWDLLKEVMYSSDNQTSALTGLIELSIAVQPVLDLCRIHESGDFWTELYMRAWLNAARNHSDIKFYAYTKSLGMWLNLKQYIPSNFYLTASVGGTLDTMIPGNLGYLQAYCLCGVHRTTSRRARPRDRS